MINEKLAKKYCKEDISKIKNYDKAIADTNLMWVCHHMTETWWHCSRKELIENECYYNRKACELIFLTPSEHTILHNTGKHHSEETRKKLSEALQGRPSAMKGVTLSAETRKKISEAGKGRSPWNKGLRNIYSEETRRKMSEAKKNMSEETRRKISEANYRRYAATKNIIGNEKC